MYKVIALALAIAATTTVAGAQSTSASKAAVKQTASLSTTKRHRRAVKKETQADLQKEAKVSEADARATALQQVPNGAVKSVELEREKGKLIYSYDITVPGKSGVEEVNINAVDGSFVGKMHESAKTEKKEAKQEAKEKKTTK
ncbi:MAG TPA: PepSY domain-containing protein [Gemmatimonadaceae bacterium]